MFQPNVVHLYIRRPGRFLIFIGGLLENRSIGKSHWASEHRPFYRVGKGHKVKILFAVFSHHIDEGHSWIEIIKRLLFALNVVLPQRWEILDSLSIRRFQEWSSANDSWGYLLWGQLGQRKKSCTCRQYHLFRFPSFTSSFIEKILSPHSSFSHREGWPPRQLIHSSSKTIESSKKHINRSCHVAVDGFSLPS